MQQYPHQYHQQEQRQLDAFLARVMKRLTVSRTALRTTTRYFDAYSVEQTPGGQARAVILPYSDYLCALAAGHGATTRTEYLRSVEMTAADHEQDANECSKMLQRSNFFLDRTTSKALPNTSTIITRSIVERSKTAVTKKIASTTSPSLLRRATNARYLLMSRNGYIPASESPADGWD